MCKARTSPTIGLMYTFVMCKYKLLTYLCSPEVSNSNTECLVAHLMWSAHSQNDHRMLTYDSFSPTVRPVGVAVMAGCVTWPIGNVQKFEIPNRSTIICLFYSRPSLQLLSGSDEDSCLSRRRLGQDKTRLSCRCRRYELNWRQSQLGQDTKFPNRIAYV